MISASGQVKPKGGVRRGPLAHTAAAKPASPRIAHLEDFHEALNNRDFSKAVAILEVYKEIGQTLADDMNTNAWLGYAAFHMRDYAKALEVYKEMVAGDDASAACHLYMACCHYGMGEFAEAEQCAMRGPDSSLKNRLLYHIAQKRDDQEKVKKLHTTLLDTADDQLSLAAMHFSRTHYEDAARVYKRIVVSERREYAAVNVYISQCYNKMDMYDYSNDLLQMYLQGNPHSAVAINLRACNHFRLFNGKAAEAELKVLMDLQSASYNVENPIVNHNLVVFRGGENALQVFPPLVDVIPEARLNLVVYYLKNEQYLEAYDLVKNLEPKAPVEHNIKAVACALVGQQYDHQDPIQMAQRLFHDIGNSESEKNTIPGRQCMAQQYFLNKAFDEVVKYLSSIKMYFNDDSTFHFMYGVALAATAHWAEAEEVLQMVQNERLKAEFTYTSWLIRSHIMARHPKKAWDMYMKMETTQESFVVVQLIAGDCYQAGAFYFAAKAYDVLEKLEASEHNWMGKRGACIGVFQQVVAGKEPADSFWDVVKFLESSVSLHAGERPQFTAQAEQTLRVMKNWARESGLKKR